MRKDKTYEQQKKFYDESGQYESLGAMFICLLVCGYMTPAEMQSVFREGNHDCKDSILEELYHLCDKEIFYKFVRIFYFGKM